MSCMTAQNPTTYPNLSLQPSQVQARFQFRVTPSPLPPPPASSLVSTSHSASSSLPAAAASMDSSRSSLLDDDYDNYPAHTRLPNEQVLELYAELTLQGEYHLLPYEEDWKARRPFLESKGYELRPRYNEDWWPSWIGTDINPFFCEDSIDSCVRFIFPFFLFPFSFFPFLSFTFSFCPEGPFLFYNPVPPTASAFPIGAEGAPTQEARNAYAFMPLRITMHLTFIGVLEFNRCCFNLVCRYKAHTRATLSPPMFSLFAFVRWHGRYVQPSLKRGRNAPAMRAVCTGLAVATPRNSSLATAPVVASCHHPPLLLLPDDATYTPM